MSYADEPSIPPSNGSAEFVFDLAGPLFEQIRCLLESIIPVPMDLSNIGAIPAHLGLYLLLRLGAPVYVGKADDAVPDRLVRHRNTLKGRRNLKIEEMTYKCITFAATWNPFLPEKNLIEYYCTSKGEGWNNKGFGSNEPGINRKETKLADDNFYKRFPLRDDWLCSTIAPGDWNTLKLLQAIKNEVPFYFRFPGNRLQGDGDSRKVADEARRDYGSIIVKVTRANMTARELLVLVASNLPGRWQATITPSHMLLYKEANAKYPEMEVVWPQA